MSHFTTIQTQIRDLNALHETFADGREPTAKDILEAIMHTVPLAQLMDGQISALRHWARGRARDATAPVKPTRSSRKITHAN